MPSTTPLTLLLTRPVAAATVWAQALTARGLSAQVLPLLQIGPAPDAAALQAAWTRLAEVDLVLFVSGHAVAAFFAARPPGASWPTQLRAACVGEATARALRAQGLSAPLTPPPEASSDSESLWAVLGQSHWAGRQVLIVRGQNGRDWLAERWAACGAHVMPCAAYTREPAEWTPAQAALAARAWAAPSQWVWLFSSPQALEVWAQRCPETLARGEVRALATHPRLAAAATALGLGDVHCSRPDLDAVAASLESFS